MGQLIIVGKILIQLLTNRLQVNYVNALMYPVIVRDFASPKNGIIGISIGDLTSKSAL